MRYHDNGSLYSVSISANDVSFFASRWPCFGSIRPVWAQFDKSTGDLIDLRGDNDMDGAGLCALLEDAKAYAAPRIK